MRVLPLILLLGGGTPPPCRLDDGLVKRFAPGQESDWDETIRMGMSKMLQERYKVLNKREKGDSQ